LRKGVNKNRRVIATGLAEDFARPISGANA
jgi:hypothetical protein